MSVPTMVLAPPRLSTMMRWPSASPILSASKRASTSLPPPGGYGEIRRIGRRGNDCACAGIVITVANNSTNPIAQRISEQFTVSAAVDRDGNPPPSELAFKHLEL